MTVFQRPAKVEKARPLRRVEVITGVARRHGLSPQQLFGWRSQFKVRAIDFMERSAPAFAPAIVDDAEPSVPPVKPSIEPSSLIEVTVGRARIVIRGTVDQRTISTILEALKGRHDCPAKWCAGSGLDQAGGLPQGD
jgi:transposase